MSNINADIIRLFTTVGNFLTSSIRGQLGFDITTKQAMLHNLTDDTVAMTWSDDSKQVLLAGNQTVTGVKTFSADIVTGASIRNAGSNSSLGLNANATLTGNSVVIQTNSGSTNISGTTSVDISSLASLNLSATTDISLQASNNVFITPSIDADVNAGVNMNLVAANVANVTATAGDVNVTAGGVINANSDVVIKSSKLLKLNDAGNTTSITLDNNANAMDTKGSNATALILNTTNTNNTNTLTTNNLTLNHKLTQDVGSGGSAFDALKVDIKKVVAWTNANLLESEVKFFNRSTDYMTSIMRPFLTATGLATTFGDETTNGYITTNGEIMEIHSGNSSEGLSIITAGIEVANFTDDNGIIFQNTVRVTSNAPFYAQDILVVGKSTLAMANSFSKYTPVAINTTAEGTLAVVNSGVFAGAITSTSAATVTLQLDSVANIITYFNAQLDPTTSGFANIGENTNIRFIVNNYSGANTVTVVVGTGISVATPAITGGETLTVTTGNKIGVFNLYLTSSNTAILSRVI